MSGRTPSAALPRWRSSGWVIGIVVGLLAGTGVALATQSWQEQREAEDIAARAAVFEAEQGEMVPAPGDTVRALLSQQSPVVIDPLLARRVSEADLARVVQVLEGAAVPARLAYVRYPRTWDGFTPSGVAVQWSSGVGETGHYVVLFDNGSARTSAVGLEDPDVSANGDGQPGPALVRIAEDMATWEAEPLPTGPKPLNDFDYWGGLGGGVVAGLLFGLFLVLPLHLLIYFGVGRLRARDM